MQLKIESKEKQEETIKLGDVVDVCGSAYLVIHTPRGYIAKDFDGYSGSTGYHETLDNLHQSLIKLQGVTIYRKDEYELVLRRKVK